MEEERRSEEPRAFWRAGGRRRRNTRRKSMTRARARELRPSLGPGLAPHFRVGRLPAGLRGKRADRSEIISTSRARGSGKGEWGLYTSHPLKPGVDAGERIGQRLQVRSASGAQMQASIYLPPCEKLQNSRVLVKKYMT